LEAAGEERKTDCEAVMAQGLEAGCEGITEAMNCTDECECLHCRKKEVIKNFIAPIQEQGIEYGQFADHEDREAWADEILKALDNVR
jgi:hypothetical protein